VAIKEDGEDDALVCPEGCKLEPVLEVADVAQEVVDDVTGRSSLCVSSCYIRRQHGNGARK
jgi:hypothetical protein